MTFNNSNNFTFAAPNAAPAPSFTKRRCDSLEDDSSLHSQEDNNGPNKRIKSSHQGRGLYGQPASFQTPPSPPQAPPQYREPVQFVSSGQSAFFTYGGGPSATPFQRQP